MILLSDVRELLKQEVSCPQWHLNKMTTQKEQSITLYNLPQGQVRVPIGGIDYSSYNEKKLSILIHWGKVSDDAERKAQEVVDTLIGWNNKFLGNQKVIMCHVTGPIYVGLDDEGIIEYVVEATIYYQSKE